MSKPTTDRAAIGHVIDGLIKAGWTITNVNDGEAVRVSTKAEAMEAITAVDDAFLIVERLTTTSGRGHVDTGWVRFVMGNEPMEVVCDHTINLSDAIDPVVQPWWSE